MKVEILGSSGCRKCSALKQEVEKIVEELGKEDQVEVVKVEDLSRLAEYGVMDPPAVIVDDEVKHKGTIPSEREIRELVS